MRARAALAAGAAAIMAWTAAGAATLAEVKAARAAFEKENGAAFAKTSLVDCDAAPDAARFDKANGKSEWAILLPYSDDSRVRFVRASFADGKFASGELLVFGQKPQAIGAEAFAKLRSGFPMVAVRTGEGAVAGTAALYPADGSNSERLTPALSYTSGSFDPVSRALGALGRGNVTGRLGISCAGLSYRVAFSAPDGTEADLGVASARSGGGRVTGEIAGKDIKEKLRAAIAERKSTTADRVSDRDVVDVWVTGTMDFKGGK